MTLSPDTAGVRTATRSARVVSGLEDLVFGDLAPGSPLPSEPELAVRFGVSRLTVREAVKVLQARGVLEVAQGRRPHVAHPSSAPIGAYFAAAVRRDPRGAIDLLEVRRALEIQTATLAADRATPADLAAMESALADLAADAGTPGDFNLADVRFHESLAAATGNQVLRFLLEGLAEPLRASRLLSYRGHVARGVPISDVIDQHRAILDAVRGRDPARAARAMHYHLASTERDLRSGLAATPMSMEGERP